MKEIKLFETAKDSGKNFDELGINRTLYWAYRNSQEAGNELIDFNECIWDYDIEPIVTALKEFGITEFTISSAFSSLIETLAEFEKAGCHMAGLTEVKARYTDFMTGEAKVIPAIKMCLKK